MMSPPQTPPLAPPDCGWWQVKDIKIWWYLPRHRGNIVHCNTSQPGMQQQGLIILSQHHCGHTEEDHIISPTTSAWYSEIGETCVSVLHFIQVIFVTRRIIKMKGRQAKMKGRISIWTLDSYCYTKQIKWLKSSIMLRTCVTHCTHDWAERLRFRLKQLAESKIDLNMVIKQLDAGTLGRHIYF